MSKPLISVVIPAYNHEKFIGAAIESVLNQTLDDFELIIVDDGSTDKTAEIIKGYADKRIFYVWQENQDAFNTINRGMSMASGLYVSILNSDDIYHVNRLEKLAAFAKENRADCLFSDVIPISDNGEELTDPDFGWNQWHQKNRDVYYQHKDIYAGLLHGNYMVTTSNLFLSSVAVKKVGNFAPIRYLHDYDYIFRVMLTFPESVHYLDADKLLYYRIHGGNTLSEAAIIGRQQDLEVIEKYMLAKVDGVIKTYVSVGSNRLRALENEINEVRAQLNQSSTTNGLGKRLRGKIKRVLGR